tara:strand:- start:1670 stop:1984 length:315 start_codon:yes stop_codon:yes gene_type:complete
VLLRRLISFLLWLFVLLQLSFFLAATHSFFFERFFHPHFLLPFFISLSLSFHHFISLFLSLSSFLRVLSNLFVQFPSSLFSRVFTVVVDDFDVCFCCSLFKYYI